MKQRIKLRRKGLFFIVVLLLCGLNTSKASSQDWDHEYVPFVEEGKVWYCVLVDNILFNEDDPEPVWDCIFTMRGDSVIGEQNYKKVYCEFEKHYGDKKQHYYCAVREESYRVFFVEQDEKDEKLLYDFNSPQENLFFSRRDNQYERSYGEHMFSRPKGLYVFDIYQIIEDDEIPKRKFVNSWVEGVGADGNPFEFAIDFYCNEPTLGDIIYVSSCKIDNQYVYEEWWRGIPDISLQIGVTPFAKSTSHNIHYDLQGRPVKGAAKRGVYVKEGRKVIK
ncbi:hypothetical protein [Prevotella sp. E2-28]|uniref:hypothetical protein n=1 Tax=Prevotella sp. E2-28 TaxID=2913620 RepID=UPI001EDC7124|nr:hypothetical protein [Prevotella sp. E2-28]UKK53827.1 hypothetical protein L6465_00710 [Prevotella sp. E2-28]